MRSAAPVVALAAVLVLAGCGEKRHSSSGSSSSSGAAATISESEFKLDPSSPTVAPGGTITVKNAGTTTHALEIKLPNGDIRTKSLSPGQSVDVKAPAKAGTYQMWCPIDGHRQQGMTGQLKVGGSGGGSSGGGSSPNSSGGGGGSPGGY
jgi:plastocyanin